MQKLLIPAILSLTPVITQAAGLMVDFGSGAVASGWQGYAATNAAPDPAAVAYSAASTGFASVVTVDVDALLNGTVLTSNVPANAFRVINRAPVAVGGASGTGNATSMTDLHGDWLAVAQLPSQPETVLRITVSGLPAGSYVWNSWHHDINDQTGLLDTSFTVGSSSPLNSVIDVSNGLTPTSNVNNSAYLGSTAQTNSPVPTLFSFTVAAGENVVFQMSPQAPINTAIASPSQFQSVNFTVINGFTIEAVPEPSSATLGLGALILGFTRRRR